MKKTITLSLLALTLITSCESETDKKTRLIVEEKSRIELEQKNAQEAKAEYLRLEQVRLAQEKVVEANRIEKETQLEKKDLKRNCIIGILIIPYKQVQHLIQSILEEIHPVEIMDVLR